MLNKVRNVNKALLTGVMMAVLLEPAWSQTEETAEPAGPNWTATCTNQADPDKLACTINQTITVTQTGQRLISMSLQSGQENPSLLISLPHGLRLQSGLGFSVDKGAVELFEFTTSDATGVYARVPLTADRLASLRAGNTIKIGVTGNGGRALNFELSLAGFSATYDLAN